MWSRFFKRGPVVPTVLAATPGRDEAPVTMKERRRVPRPLPVPDVVEGNGGETDWGLWTELSQDQTAK